MIPFHWLVLAFVPALISGKLVQLPNLQLPRTAADHKKTVVDIFNQSYGEYRKYAWGHDSLLPIEKSHVDDFNGWGVTIVDAMDTMWIMNFTDWFNEAVNYVGTVDFSASKTKSNVNLFETNIRYVGGLLSAYELSGRKHDVLVQKAEQLTRKLTYAWVGNNSIPYVEINFSNHTPTHKIESITGTGTLTLEWSRLSLYSKNDTYRKISEKTVQHIMHMETPRPGMPAVFIDPSTGKGFGSYVTWGSGSDSYYEYLIKYARLTNTNDNSYADAWSAAVDTSIKDLLRTSTVGDHLYLADRDDNRVYHVGSHLACFYGGNWILGGKLTNNDTIFEIGLKLNDACWNTYASTATGIGPELFAYVSNDGNYTGGAAATAAQMEFYNQHGFYITASYYILRPEILESNFYAWRATGNTMYLDRAVRVLQSYQKYLPEYSGIIDVNKATSNKFDYMESYWFSEVLKYLYLTFDDPNVMSLDDYVFSTEGHPFRALTAKNGYGSKCSS